VLGVDPDAGAATIKAAWRRLAREHHPDLTGGDATAARTATRQMAQINAAYEELRDPARRRLAADRERASRARAAQPRRGPGHPFGGQAPDATGAGGAGDPRATAGPPRPRPNRPVTGRLDTSGTFAERNRTVGGMGRHTFAPTNLLPPRSEPEPAELPRASDPTGPLHRRRMRHFRATPAPALADAQVIEIEFGKFRGHTLGEIAAFEPSYIDWIASTITRDRDLVAAARVIKADLDARGVPRMRRPLRPGPSPLP
jgi:curved DNA-binding protein CbpA